MYLVFALATGLTNAFAVTSQHIASTSGPATLKGWRLVQHLFRHPLWLLGWIGLFGSLIFQALALHFGPLASVQPLLLVELIFALVLRWLWLHQSINSRAWIAAAVTALSLGGFLLVAAPQGSSRQPTLSSWAMAAGAIMIVTVVTVVWSWRATPSRRAAALGAVTSLVWAGEACLIKQATQSLVTHHLWGAFGDWPIYAFTIVGIAGVLLEQATLHVGPLRSSLPWIVGVDPVVSVMLGLWLFDEKLRSGILSAGACSLLLLVALASTLVLIRNTPESMEPNLRHL
jgi:drug/metabolite transporter (DMT)-like permease